MDEALLVIRGLYVSYPSIPSFWTIKPVYRPVLYSVDLVIGRREIHALVGESGCGKTTLLKTIMGFVKPVKGSILFHGVDLVRASRRLAGKLLRRISYIPQNPYNAVNPRMKIYDVIAEPLKAMKYSGSEIKRVIEEVLEYTHLPRRILGMYPGELSGGMLQRVVIARALVTKPELILLDEPTSALDVSVQARIIALLRELYEKLDLSYLLVTHDIAIASLFSHKITVLYKGVVIEQAPARELVTNPLHPYTKRLINASKNIVFESSEPIVEPTWDGVGCPYRYRCSMKTRECLDKIPSLKKVKENHYVRCFNV